MDVEYHAQYIRSLPDDLEAAVARYDVDGAVDAHRLKAQARDRGRIPGSVATLAFTGNG